MFDSQNKVLKKQKQKDRIGTGTPLPPPPPIKEEDLLKTQQTDKQTTQNKGSKPSKCGLSMMFIHMHVTFILERLTWALPAA